MMQISPYLAHWALHPSVYVAPYTTGHIEIDGNIEKEEWANVPWSSDFDDIRGQDDAPANERPTSGSRTRMKMMWDEKYLYIAAMIESEMEVRATFTKRNSPIYHEDSDFEVFVDPESSCHYYKELEMNALNTVWNLMLNKPYADGGEEFSGRIAQVGDKNYYETDSQVTAARVVEGTLNKAGPQRTVWTVEIALSHQDTLKHQSKAPNPKEGDQWRINFSRVEKKGNINWTWQKQKVWDPETFAYRGKVDMHMPDSFGYVRFGPNVHNNGTIFGEIPRERILQGYDTDLFWPLRLAAMNVYYAQSIYHKRNSRFAQTFSELYEERLVDENILKPFQFPGGIRLSSSDGFYSLQVKSLDGQALCLDKTRFMTTFNTYQELIDVLQE